MGCGTVGILLAEALHPGAAQQHDSNSSNSSTIGDRVCGTLNLTAENYATLQPKAVGKAKLRYAATG